MDVPVPERHQTAQQFQTEKAEQQTSIKHVYRTMLTNTQYSPSLTSNINISVPYESTIGYTDNRNVHK